MITKRVNPDGSITVGIIEEETKAEVVKIEPKPEVKKPAPKKQTSSKKTK